MFASQFNVNNIRSKGKELSRIAKVDAENQRLREENDRLRQRIVELEIEVEEYAQFSDHLA